MTMTSSQPMSREELLELAALDAFGLLDEYDAALFTRSFHHAPAPVQDEIKRLQAELAADPSLVFATEEPPLELRARVLAAVAAAIERDEAQLAPLATIGRSRPSDAMYQPQRLRFSGAGMFWRAACFVLAAGCIVMAYSWYTAVEKNAHIIEWATSYDTEQRLRLKAHIGEGFDDFIQHASAPARVLRPVQDDYPGAATLYLKSNADGTSSGFLLATALPVLPPNQAYTLKVKINGVWENVRAFASNGVVSGLRLDNLTAAMLASTSWQVLDNSGQVLLQT
jgi:hypothetical protein